MRDTLSSWRLPGWRAFLPELAILFGIPIYNAVTAIIDDKETSYVLLTTVGLAVLLLLGVASFEVLAQPFRRRLLEGKELIDTVDYWLREAGYGRTPYVMSGYSHTIVASYGSLDVYIGAVENQSILVFAGSRQESQTDRQLISQMTPQEWATLKYDMQLELSRFGAFFQLTDDPFKVTFWTVLPVDDSLNEAKVMERFNFIARADELVKLLGERTATTVLLTAPSAPTISDLLKSTAQQASSGTTGEASQQTSTTTTTDVP